MNILGKYTFYQRNFVSWTFFSKGNGLFLAKKLQEFVLTKSVCELIDFDFDAVLTNLGGPDFADIEKLVIQGMNSFSLYDHYSLYKYNWNYFEVTQSLIILFIRPEWNWHLKTNVT